MTFFSGLMYILLREYVVYGFKGLSLWFVNCYFFVARKGPVSLYILQIHANKLPRGALHKKG